MFSPFFEVSEVNQMWTDSKETSVCWRLDGVHSGPVRLHTAWWDGAGRPHHVWSGRCLR